jgi:hypothetical protein
MFSACGVRGPAMKLNFGGCLQMRRKMAHSTAQNKYFYKDFLSMAFFMVLPFGRKISH